MNIIQKFFEIFNFRFWLLLGELLYFPAGFLVGGTIFLWQQNKKGSSDDEIQ